MISADIKTDIKQACMFNLILVGIPYSLILFVKNRGRGEGGDGVFLLSVTKVIFRGSLSGWLLSLEFKVYLENTRL